MLISISLSSWPWSMHNKWLAIIINYFFLPKIPPSSSRNINTITLKTYLLLHTIKNHLVEYKKNEVFLIHIFIVFIVHQFDFSGDEIGRSYQYHGNLLTLSALYNSTHKSDANNLWCVCVIEISFNPHYCHISIIFCSSLVYGYKNGFTCHKGIHKNMASKCTSINKHKI